jgi:hypothetical protein
MLFTTRQATEEEAWDFSQMFVEVNWGVWLGDKMVALFQAEEEPDGWLNVHAMVKRRTLHPEITKMYAKSFANRLLELGAKGLKAEIQRTNRAAIRVARAAGFTEQGTDDEWVILTRVPNGTSKSDETAV